MNPIEPFPAPRSAPTRGTLADLVRPGAAARRVHVPVLAALLAAASLGGCTRAGRPAGSGPAPVAVAVEVVGGPGEPAGLVIPARIKARDEVTLTARMAARVTALPAPEGARVRAGQTLAVFDAPEAARALAAARAERDAAHTAAMLAERDAGRAESLWKAGVIAAREREHAESERESAAARLESAEAALAGLGEATAVRAPFDGVVARLHVDVGADLAPGAPILDVRSSGPLEVVAPVPESAVEALGRGALAVQVRDGPWRDVRLARLDGMTDFASRTRTAHLVPGDPAGWEPGDYARLRIAAAGLDGDAAVSSVARSALVTRGGLTGVYVVDEGRAWLRWIKPGRAMGDRLEVLAGLAAGERVARSTAALRDGARVTVRP